MTAGHGDEVSTTCVSGWAHDSRDRADKSWRVFIAIELPRNVRARLAEHIKILRDSIPEVRASWSREDNLHLTLKFLGDIPSTNVGQLSAAASIAASKVEPFEIIVEGCGAFPPRGQPKVLWIGILSEPPAGRGPRRSISAGVEDAGGPDPSPSLLPLRALHSALEDECAKAGFAREPRAFHPHLTIARIRQPHGSRELAARHKEIGFNREVISVSELAVIRSELRSEGSRHTIISRHAFSLSTQ
jgi:RNA 2',3'-cyclic 3'-phosphodiesterase